MKKSYDAQGRPFRSTNAVGTVTELRYDSLGRLYTTAIGTTQATPLIVEERIYDDNWVRDGNLTVMIQYPGGGAASRVTRNYYDWRNRLIITQAGFGSADPAPLTLVELDNLGQVLSTKTEEVSG